jgi:hypothetical protein
MPPVSALTTNPGGSATTPQIDLASIAPATQKMRLFASNASVSPLAQGTPSKIASSNLKSTERSTSTLRSCPPSTGRMPSAYVVSNTTPPTRINVDDIPYSAREVLNKSVGWSPVLGGKLEVRYSPAESAKAGVPVYELRGAKSTVKLKANTWVDAAKEAVRLSAAGALAPRTVAAVKSAPSGNGEDNPNPAVRSPIRTA